MHKEAHEAGSAHESTDLRLHEDGNVLQAGRGRGLQDAKEKEILQGGERRLRIDSQIRSFPFESGPKSDQKSEHPQKDVKRE